MHSLRAALLLVTHRTCTQHITSGTYITCKLLVHGQFMNLAHTRTLHTHSADEGYVEGCLNRVGDTSPYCTACIKYLHTHDPDVVEQFYDEEYYM
jgi:hypothetical protein